LTISGEHKVDEEEERGGYHVRERRYGTFRRSMTLPEGVDDSKTTPASRTAFSRSPSREQP